MIKPGMRVRHQRLGDGLTILRNIDPCSNLDYYEAKIALVMFDSLPEGYQNPFTVDFEKIKPI
jgi:hypothetical protein